ncbi:MAG: type II secretion system F family protein [Candidatus Woesearchaeota archaeon]
MGQISDLISAIKVAFPNLSEQLRKAHMKESPEVYIKKSFLSAFMFSLLLLIFFFMIFKVFKISQMLSLALFPLTLIIFFMLFIKAPIVKIKRRMRELDKEVLFAGRFLLVKIHSGKPLLNALIEASRGYGIASAYFKEIVDDINMGTPIEEALENAIRYSPSDKFRKIIFHISNAIKIGVDVSGSLSAAIDEIAKEQLIEIQKYGRKLNSLSMFYMLLAVVMPSLGVAMLLVIGTLIGAFTSSTLWSLLIFVLIFLLIIQLLFLTLFKSIRLTVNL